MKRYIFPLLLILVLGAFQACKEPLPEEIISPTPAYCLEEGSEYLIPLVDSCRTQPFPRSGPIWIPPNAQQEYQYYRPMASALDPNQVIYQRGERDSSSKLDQLWTINLCTGDKALLVEGIHSAAAQSKSGWILYNTGNKLWKIKANGDSLTQLANYLYQFSWHPSGHQIIGRMVDGSRAIVDAQGQLLQILPSLKGYGTGLWSPDGDYISLIGGDGNNIRYLYLYEVATGQIEKIVPASSSYHHWLDEHHLLIHDQTGSIIKFHIHSHQIVSNLIPSCVNLRYVPNSLSTDGQYLFCGYNLFEESIPGSSILNSYTKLVVMDIDGGNRREIVVE
jgi:hypothetical protein